MTTATATTGPILALDLGQYKTVACAYPGDPAAARFESLLIRRLPMSCNGRARLLPSRRRKARREPRPPGL
jgi:hypothetical protein